jgi:hypothetical protein
MRRQETERAASLSRALGVFSHCYSAFRRAAGSVNTARAFLYPPPFQLHDPYLMPQCVVLPLEGAVAHGSGRSIQPYHLLNGLNACSDLFDEFARHSHAAGISTRT